MPVVLTSQEKKVLGFLAIMVALGLVMLGIKRLDTSGPKPETPASAQSTAVSTIP